MIRIFSARCSQKTAADLPCRSWALRGSHPPICSIHARQADRAAKTTARNPISKKPPRPIYRFSDRGYTLEEVADLINLTLAGDDRDGQTILDLKDELAVARVTVRRLLLRMRDELPPQEFARLAGQIFRGADTIGRLTRIQRILESHKAGSLAGALAQALDELGQEWGIIL